MERRRVLRAVAAGLSAIGTVCLPAASGCLSRFERPATSPAPSPPVESRVDVPPCPTRPDPLTASAAATFAVRFEKAHVARVILRDHERVTYVDFLELGSADGSNATVAAVDGGFRVRFSARPAFGYRMHPGTPESAHVDFAAYTAHYFVDEQTVRRAKSTGETPVDPRESGAEVDCPPGE